MASSRRAVPAFGLPSWAGLDPAAGERGREDRGEEAGLRDGGARRRISVPNQIWGDLEEAFPRQAPPATRKREREAERNPSTSRSEQVASIVRGDAPPARDGPHARRGSAEISPRKPRASDLFHAREHGQQLVDVGGQVQLVSEQLQGDKGVFLRVKASPPRIGPTPEEIEAERQQESSASREKCLHTALLAWKTFVEMYNQQILPRTPLSLEEDDREDKFHRALQGSVADLTARDLQDGRTADPDNGLTGDTSNNEQRGHEWFNVAKADDDERRSPQPEPVLEDEWSWLGERSRDVARVLRVHGNPHIAPAEQGEHKPVDLRIQHAMAVKIQAAARGRHGRARANALRCARKEEEEEEEEELRCARKDEEEEEEEEDLFKAEEAAPDVRAKDAETVAKDLAERSKPLSDHPAAISEAAKYETPERDKAISDWLAGAQITAGGKADGPIPVTGISSTSSVSDLAAAEVAKSATGQEQTKASRSSRKWAQETGASKARGHPDLPLQFVANARDAAYASSDLGSDGTSLCSIFCAFACACMLTTHFMCPYIAG